jgi:type III pantothenate kinase
MLLAVDIGNTRTKLGIFQQRTLKEVITISNSEIPALPTLLNVTQVQACIVSSVNKEAEKRWDFEQESFDVLYLDHKTSLPIQLVYQTPDTLGKDRIAAVVGAEMLFPEQAKLVIDIGTCITYDFLTADKRYLGGAISPGIQMRLKSMHQFTNQLPLINWGEEDLPQLTGSSTITSMLSGVVNGILKELQGFESDYKKQYPQLKTVITGGDASFFEKELKNGIFADPNLVLKGLNEILIYNSR